MQSIGEKLRQARLKKQVSLDEVYRQTKIHPQVLEALEQDRADSFLSPLYVKGFLKTYARYLGLDAERLLKEYIDSQKVEIPPGQASSEKKGKVFPQVNLFLFVRIAAVLILSFTLILYFRFLIKRISHPVQKIKEQQVKIKVVPAPKVLAKDLVLEVKAKDTCWLRVKTDNQIIFEKTLPKGRRELWRAKQKIELRIGKPEALEVFLNGRPLDLKKTKVKIGLVITHEGIKGR